MKKVIVIYDDSLKPNKEIRSITGDKSYGNTIFKRVTLKNRMREEIEKNKNVISMYSIDDRQEVEKLKEELTKTQEGQAVFYLYSNFGLADTVQFQTLLTKTAYVNECYTVYCGDQPAAVMLPDVESYNKKAQQLLERNVLAEQVETTAFMDLSDLNHFLTFITGGFDARFFNALAGDAYTVTKRSTKTEKIKSEYKFYYLLPDNMKMWFVMPYDYQEDENGASYTMERYHMTDIAIRFVHGAVSTEELSDILDKLFYFINIRGRKQVSEKEAKAVADALYVEKLKERMADLKKLPAYSRFDALLSMGTSYDSIDAVVEKYLQLYEKIAARPAENALVIGHGDLCFSNILYSKEANLLKLIDPKGALNEEDMYTDVYYDLAKLSHSICGCYDFFNSGLYLITMDRDMKIHLSIDADAAPYIEVFRKYLEKNGFDYVRVRLYEASLFLSMLPYHMDQPGKVFGFLMNAIRILEEVSTCTKI